MAYIILALATAMGLTLIVSTNSLDINVLPEFVRPNDKNVVFNCAGGNDTKTTSQKMFRMRLMKLDDDGQWMEVVVLRLDGSIVMNDANAMAVGSLGDVVDSHLVVTWQVAPDNINGRYRCDAITLTSTGDVVKEQSRDLDVKSLSNDLSHIFERLKKSEKRLVGKVNETLHDVMRSSKTDVISMLDSDFRDLKTYLDNKTTVGVREPEENVETMHWPAGRFNLLMPSDGCPKHPPAWIKSFHRIKALPGDKYYPVDVPLHLALPHKKDGFIYRHFCELPAFPERTEPWPPGSYCMYSMYGSSQCPVGFTYAEARSKISDDKGNLYVYYYADYSHLQGTFQLSASRFCCRHDGSASAPIQLPVSDPFYLFRHGGRCQEVKGMDVTQDVFMMETVDDDRYDKWLDNNPDFHPDVSFKPYKEELCYYSRKKV